MFANVLLNLCQVKWFNGLSCGFESVCYPVFLNMNCLKSKIRIRPENVKCNYEQLYVTIYCIIKYSGILIKCLRAEEFFVLFLQSFVVSSWFSAAKNRILVLFSFSFHPKIFAPIFTPNFFFSIILLRQIFQNIGPRIVFHYKTSLTHNFFLNCLMVVKG